MKIFARFILVILSFIVIFFLIITGLFAINKYFNKVTYIGDFTSFVSVGYSMYPTIKPDSFLLLKKENDYLYDDIITFMNDEGNIVTHRIIRLNDNNYVTKGDNNNFSDGYIVHKENIYGKVIWIIPGLSTFLKFKYFILAFILITPVILFIIKRGKHVR